MAGDDQHQDVGVTRPRGFEHHRPLTVWQPQIGDDDVERESLQMLQRLGHRRGFGDGEAGAGEIFSHPPAKGAFVIDEQQRARGLAHGRQYIDTSGSIQGRRSTTLPIAVPTAVPPNARYQLTVPACHD